MRDPAITALEEKLDDVLSKLKKSTDPVLRRNLLAEMRTLMAELDRLVFDSARSYSARPQSQ
jgi:hypothetical protein